MKNLFLSYELALLAKEKGFDKDCFRVYSRNRKLTNDELLNPNDNKWINAPLYQQIVDWFREKYNIHIRVDCIIEYNEGREDYLKLQGYSLWISQFQNDDIVDSDELGRLAITIYKDYYEALNKAIIEAFKLIIT